MKTQEQLELYGLTPADECLDAIRRTLANEIEIENQAGKRTDDLALPCCVQLFSRAQLEDVLLIWEAKSSSFDLGCYLDVQLLCGAGLDLTKQFLSTKHSEMAKAALTYIEECELAGDFDDWSPSKQMEYYRSYFGRA